MKANPQILSDYPYPTIYHEYLRDEKNAPSVVQLRDEAVFLVTAGTDTTGDALTVGIINVISRPHTLAKLLEELYSVWPYLEDVPRLEVLEKLPYLVRSVIDAPPKCGNLCYHWQTAVIKESLRFSHGVVQPMSRIVPSTGTTLSGASIPGGVRLFESCHPYISSFRARRSSV